MPDFGRGYPPQWTNVTMDRAQLKTQVDLSRFGVSLVQPVDIYQQAERAVKYAALFIVMTFVVFFLWETLRSRLLHPIQYLVRRLRDVRVLSGSPWVSLFAAATRGLCAAGRIDRTVAMLALLMYATRHLNWYELRLGEGTARTQ